MRLILKFSLIFFLSLIFFIVVCIFLLHGVSFQPRSVDGCYIQENVLPVDKICLYKGGKYEQLSISESLNSFDVYNSGDWRSYLAKENDNEVIAVNLSNFFDRFGDNSELDIFPYKTMFGRILFMVSGKQSSEDRFYKKIKDRK